MPVNTAPIFIKTPKNPSARISAANTAADGSGVLVTVFTAGADGSRIEQITFTSSQATAGLSAARVCRIFISDNTGSNPRIRGEVALAAVTRSATATGATATFTFSGGEPLEPGQIVYVTQSVRGSAADDTDVFVKCGHFS